MKNKTRPHTEMNCFFVFFSYEMENTSYGAADKKVVCKNDIGHVHSI
jgi:hypothetical protein